MLTLTPKINVTRKKKARSKMSLQNRMLSNLEERDSETDESVA